MSRLHKRTLHCTSAVAALAALALPSVDVQAQRRDTLASPHPPAPAPIIQPRVRDEGLATMTVAGTLAAVIGFAGGAVIGYRLEREHWPCRCDDPGLGGLILGSYLGSTLLVPTTVHLVNRGRGSFPLVLGATAGVGALGFVGLMASARSEAGLLFLFGTPAAQVIVSTLVERSTARKQP